MGFVFFLFFFFVGGGWLIGKIAQDILFPKSNVKEYYPTKEPTIIHNHITENHLHISKEDLTSLTESKP